MVLEVDISAEEAEMVQQAEYSPRGTVFAYHARGPRLEGRNSSGEAKTGCSKHICNLRTQEAEAGGSGVQGRPGLSSKTLLQEES